MWLQRAVIVVLCSIFLVPFVIADGGLFPNLLFPYVTGKVLVFQALVELAAAFYIVLILREPEYRPRPSWLTWAACAFVSWGAICVFTSVDPLLSFWDDAERQNGYVVLLHAFVYFLMVGAVISAENWWKTFFQISLVASTVMAGYALLQGFNIFSRHATLIDGTFGNSTYLAVYMLYGIFIALLLAMRNRNALAARWPYLLSIAVQFLALYQTQERGPLLALAAGLIVAAAFVAWRARLPDQRNLRRAAWGVLAAVALVFVALLASRELLTAPGGGTLRRISSMSLEDPTIKSRVQVWRIGWQGFTEKPVFGWGQGNVPVVAEQFQNRSGEKLLERFDSAHSQFLDWLVAGGLPMLLLYVSLFALAARSAVSGDLPVPEQAALLGLLMACFFNNLVIFESLVGAMYFWLILAFASSLAPMKSFAALPPWRPMSNAGIAVAAPIVAIVVGAGIWAFNAPGYTRTHDLIRTMRFKSQQEIGKCMRAPTAVAC